MNDRPGSLPKRLSENKSQNNMKHIGKVRIFASKLAPGEGKAITLFASFSSMGHPWGPEWAQDPSQEPPGPLRTSILSEF